MRWTPPRWRLTAAATLILACGCSQPPGAAPPRTSGVEPPAEVSRAVQRFTADVYGASGAAQLPDGRVLIAEDDERHPLIVIGMFGDGASKSFTPREVTRALGASGAKGLNDLEALAIDPRGHVYAATSHSPNAKGLFKPEREQLVRFDLTNDRLGDMRVYTGLKPALSKLDPLFANAALVVGADAHGGLNIEGLAWDPGQKRLLIGLRSPRRGRDALLVWLQNPDAVFERDEEPSLLPPVELNLGGEGIRDVTYSPTLHGFLIVAGAWRQDKHAPPSLWFWRGGAERAFRLQAAGFEDLNPEGLADIDTGHGRALLMVSDDGGADELFYRGRALVNHGTPGRYVTLSFDRLLRDNPGLK